MSVEKLIEKIAAKDDSVQDAFTRLMYEKISARIEEKKISVMSDLVGGKQKIVKTKPIGKKDSSKEKSLSAKRLPKDKYGI